MNYKNLTKQITLSLDFTAPRELTFDDITARSLSRKDFPFTKVYYSNKQIPQE